MITSREEFWDAYAEAIQPGFFGFGRNLDALNDALAGGPGWPGDDFVLHINNSDSLAVNLGAEFVNHLREIFDAHSATLELA